MRRLSAQDDQWLAIDTPTNPIQIAGLLFFDADEAGAQTFYDAVRSHVARRLPATPLLVVHRRAPRDYDAGVWCDVTSCDLDYHVVRVDAEWSYTRNDLHDFVANEVLQPWAPGKPPFRIFVFDRLVDGGAAIVLRTHHSVADGVGFQAIVEALTDASPVPSYDAKPRKRSERAASAPLWLWRSNRRFRAEAMRRQADEADRFAAKAELDTLRTLPEFRRHKTPEVPGLSGPTSRSRSYDTLSLSLDHVKAIGKAFGGTVNDVMLTLVGGALRAFLAETGRLDALGDAPLVAMAPRSLRRPEDGAYGNHIVIMLTQLGTHIADPRERLQSVKATMRAEIRRSDLQRRAVDTDDRPYGARDRRKGEVLLAAGNVSVSNVPGPAEPRYLAGYLQLANFPAPSLPAGHFLNVTLRRYRDHLDLGISADPVKVPNVASITNLLRSTFDDMAALVVS